MSNRQMSMSAVNDFISECGVILDKREANAPAEYWMDGQDESYCVTCFRLLYPDAKLGDDCDGGWCCAEQDGSVFCEKCGCVLGYTLTDYGVDYELECFKEYEWDWNSADTCYQLNRLVNCAFTNEQKRELVAILKRGKNPPPEITALMPTPKSRAYVLRGLDNDIYCSSTGHHFTDIYLSRRGKRQQGWDYDIDDDAVCGVIALSVNIPKYLRDILHRELLSILKSGDYRVYEFDRDGNKRYEDLRYHRQEWVTETIAWLERKVGE